jgi:hypothetical protein
MIVPVERERGIVSLKCCKGRCTGGDLLEMRRHAHSLKLNGQIFKGFRAGSCAILWDAMVGESGALTKDSQ